jgi:murein DD-endopeptidase MepM/ murein hydrolase activator NlpD
VTAARSLRARYAAAAALLLLAGAARAAADPPPRPPAAGEARVHVVARGDTLSGIAARYGVSVGALVSANRLGSERTLIRIGQRLVVPGLTVSATPPRRTRPAPASVPGRTARGCCGPRGLVLSLPDFVDLSPPFAWPVEGPITSTFGRRRSGWHRGIDIKAERGAAIFASAAGVVVASDVEPRYGRVVKIEHEGRFLTVYAHNEENLVEPGTRVAAGDPIATVGRSGRATAYHVHFEIRHDGAVYNPLYLLPLPPRMGQVEETDEAEEEHD